MCDFFAAVLLHFFAKSYCIRKTLLFKYFDFMIFFDGFFAEIMMTVAYPCSFYGLKFIICEGFLFANSLRLKYIHISNEFYIKIKFLYELLSYTVPNPLILKIYKL